jgi:hypothetical protein
MCACVSLGAVKVRLLLLLLFFTRDIPQSMPRHGLEHSGFGPEEPRMKRTGRSRHTSATTLADV